MGIEKYYRYIMGNRNVKYTVAFRVLPSVTAEHKWVGAQCVDNYIYGIPNDMNAVLKHTEKADVYLGKLGEGLFKWTGGCVWEGFLYAFSRTSNSLLKMSLDAETMEYITLSEKYSQEHHYGGICTKSGIVYQPPRDSDHILVWNLKTGRTERIYLSSKKENKKFRYCGSVLHPNGYAYFLPELNERVIKLETETGKWSFIGENIDAMVFDAKIAADGNIYGYSAYCNGILKLCTETEKVEMVHQEIKPGAYGSKLGVNGHIYSIPGDGSEVWDFDPFTDSLKSIYRFSKTLSAKYAGGASLRNGDIYAVPAKANELFCLELNVDGLEIPEDIWMDFFSDFY